MGNRYVNVTITRQTKAVSQAGFGLPLILSTEKDAAYKEYTELSGIGTDYGETSETYKLANAIMGQNPRPAKVAVFGTLYDAAVGVATDLSAALNELVKTHDDFYYLASVEQGDAEITELASWTSARDKLYFATTSNQALALTHENAIILVHDKPAEYPAEAWIGVCAPQEIGSYTWTFKTLSGITPAAYDITTVQAIEDANMSAYIKEGGVNITSKGVTTSGEYIDIIQGTHYLTARITEAVFGLLVRNPKIPYTVGGINMVVAEIEGVLKRAANQGIIALDADGQPLFTVKAPNLDEISTNDKANRLLPNLDWEATVAGAVENADINGVLKL